MIFHYEQADQTDFSLDGHEDYIDRVVFVLRVQKRTKSWLAKEIGISRQAMNYCIEHGSKARFSNEIAIALGVRKEWLLEGKGNMTTANPDNEGIIKLPLIKMSDVYAFLSGDISSSETVISNNHLKKECFAVQLESTSMEPAFKKGALLIFDSSKKPESEDYVLFKLKSSNEIMFRQLLKEGRKTYLKAADPMYTVIKEHVIIIGVLVESRYEFK